MRDQEKLTCLLKISIADMGRPDSLFDARHARVSACRLLKLTVLSALIPGPSVSTIN